VAGLVPKPAGPKVFCFFFFKKEALSFWPDGQVVDAGLRRHDGGLVGAFDRPSESRVGSRGVNGPVKPGHDGLRFGGMEGHLTAG
jgi:hypothetical protein